MEAITNDKMVAGRFLKIHTGRTLHRRIQATFAAGFRVQISTCTRATLYHPKHAGMFRVTAGGSVMVQRGKAWDCVNHCGFIFESRKAA